MIIYNFLFYCLIPFILIRLWYRGIKAPKYRQRWLERFAFFDVNSVKGSKKIVWIHAVSVGEVLAAKPLIEKLLNQSTCHIVITTTTPTGSDQVKKLFSNDVFHVYAPYDLYGTVSRFLKKIQPDVVLIIETEIWPNIIYLCEQRHIPTILVNGRLSEKSLGRYAKLNTFSSAIFEKISLIFAQTDMDAGRFEKLGAKNIVVTGSIKSDIYVQQEQLDEAENYGQFLFGENNKTVLLAASTHAGEDEIVLKAYAELKREHPNLFLILVPRHPERFDEVDNLCQQRNFLTLRKSAAATLEAATDVLLVDTMGELFVLYGLADIVIMGGTFINNGGHNFLEPCAWGLPIVSGKSDYNFSVLAKELMENTVLAQVEDEKELVTELDFLIKNKSVRKEKSHAAKKYIESKRGALDEVFKKLGPYIE